MIEDGATKKKEEKIGRGSCVFEEKITSSESHITNRYPIDSNDWIK